jgi:hypothetical protein
MYLRYAAGGVSNRARFSSLRAFDARVGRTRP